MLVHMDSTSTPSDGVVLRRLRTALLALMVFGMVGLTADLLLLGHYEDTKQLPPLVLLAAGLCVTAWVWISASRAALTTLRVAMVLFLVAGAVGIVLHYEGNSEFQHEMDPSLTGWPLFVKVMQAKAPPALAPASMMQIGLLGLLYAYRMPTRRATAPAQFPSADRRIP
jgi:hypothetical protein